MMTSKEMKANTDPRARSQRLERKHTYTRIHTLSHSSYVQKEYFVLQREDTFGPDFAVEVNLIQGMVLPSQSN